MRPARGGRGGLSTPLSSTRARAVRGVDGPSPPPSGAGGRPRADGIDEAVSALSALAANPGVDADLQKTFGELADDMTAVQRFRAETVAGLAEAAAELLHAVEEAKKNAFPPVPRDVHNARVAEAEKEKERVMTEIVEGRQKVEDARANARDVEKQAREAEERALASRKAVRESLPVLDAKLKLYTVVSKAKLYHKPQSDASDAADDGVVEGFVMDKPNSDVRPFRYDLAVTSRADIVNALWDLM